MTVPAPGDAHLAQLRKLTEVSRALTYTTSLQQVTRLTVERGADLIDAACAVLMLPDAYGVLQVRSSCGVRDEDVERLHAPLTDDGVGRLQELLGVPDDRFVAVPLVVGGAVTGLLAAATRQPSTSTDETLLSALADQAALALENARLGGEVREEMEDRLRASEGATDAQERALSTLAHDIRTPLGAIDGYCENLEIGVYGPVNDRQREALGRVRMSGRHLLSLLDNVMEMARLNAGVLRMGAEPVELADVAREAVHMLLPAAQAKLVALEAGAVEEVTVTADHARVRQVLVNLVGNAVKFTPADGSVTVSTAVVSIDGSAWGEIRVADTGPGIAPAEQAAIFEPYYRSEETAQLPGVGLGLAISQALVRQMEGELALESEPGAGSTFIVRFPALPLP
ncbi:MAG TPA: HAMP domain-containing sensor histidine kinase [Longimicrobium sp.]|jgi:signal transduction histidine kinase|uniref:GAF domain-containing sensor histidine kinase n=1 Tax=Longimicrobium sp. TaxID=2029185 RepID=UPI002ED9F03F